MSVLSFRGVGMLKLAFSSKHRCAQARPRRANGVAVHFFVLFEILHSRQLNSIWSFLLLNSKCSHVPVRSRAVSLPSSRYIIHCVWSCSRISLQIAP